MAIQNNKGKIPCSYGWACTRPGCIYSHPPGFKRRKKKVPNPKGSSSAGSLEANNICVHFLSNSCEFGQCCMACHPTDQRICAAMIFYLSTIPCIHGNSCTSKNCLYWHAETELREAQEIAIASVLEFIDAREPMVNSYLKGQPITTETNNENVGIIKGLLGDLSLEEIARSSPRSILAYYESLEKSENMHSNSKTYKESKSEKNSEDEFFSSFIAEKLEIDDTIYNNPNSAEKTIKKSNSYISQYNQDEKDMNTSVDIVEDCSIQDPYQGFRHMDEENESYLNANDALHCNHYDYMELEDFNRLQYEYILEQQMNSNIASSSYNYLQHAYGPNDYVPDRDNTMYCCNSEVPGLLNSSYNKIAPEPKKENYNKVIEKTESDYSDDIRISKKKKNVKLINVNSKVSDGKNTINNHNKNLNTPIIDNISQKPPEPNISSEIKTTVNYDINNQSKPSSSFEITNSETQINKSKKKQNILVDIWDNEISTVTAELAKEKQFNKSQVSSVKTYSVVSLPLIYYRCSYEADPNLFKISNPIERAKSVTAQLGLTTNDVIDLHYQSRATLGIVLSALLPRKKRDGIKKLWLFCGAGHHVPGKSHQIKGGILIQSTVAWLEEYNYSFDLVQDAKGLTCGALVRI